MTAPDTEVSRGLRAALARRLADAGDLRSPEWRAALEDVPRHLFVPVFHQQTSDGGRWETVTYEDPRHLEAVYGNRPLITRLLDGRPTSSSSQPSLMVSMLEALDVRDGHRVGEVATGTGYNAALLCHRVGHGNVTTIDVDPDLAHLARYRLAHLGYHPDIVVGDARQGFPLGTVVDRLIVTCGLHSFPGPLVRALRPGGVAVVPLGEGNARLIRRGDGALEGRFLPMGACFMPARAGGGSGAVPYPGEPQAQAVRRLGMLGPEDLADPGFRFLRSLVLPGLGEATETDRKGRVTGCRLWAGDGSWAHVDGETVQQGGPVLLWDATEDAAAWYESRARPERSRFGATVTPDGETIYWIDAPTQTLLTAATAHGTPG